MDILKVKQGNDWIPIPAIQGEKGDHGIQGIQGPAGADGYTPVKGTDYWTSADKEEIVSEVSSSVPVQDVQVNGTSILNNGVANVPVASADNLGVIKVGDTLSVNSANRLNAKSSGSSIVKIGTASGSFITPEHQHEATFYGLAKAAGDSTQSASNNAVGTYTNEAKAAIKSMIGVTDPTVSDVQVNGASVLNNGVANVPYASSDVAGAIKIGTGLYNANGKTVVDYGSSAQIKAATANIGVPVSRQHIATFYGLAKLAGADMKNLSDETIGVYPDAQKVAIKSMLGISDDISDLKNSKAPVIIDTAEGDIASFPDGADNLPVESLVINIEPIQSGSGDPSPENVRPIQGWTGINITACGVNLFDASGVPSNSYYLNSLGVQVSNNAYNTSNYIRVKPSTVYYYAIDGVPIDTSIGSHSAPRVAYYDVDKNYLSSSGTIGLGVDFTTPSNAAYIRVPVFKRASNQMLVEDSVIPSSYTPYSGSSYPVTFPDGETVYGGTLNMTTGVLTIESVSESIDLTGKTYATSDGYDSWDLTNAYPSTQSGSATGKFCDKAKYSWAGSTLMTSHFYKGVDSTILFLPEGQCRTDTVQIVYPLATPYTIQLTPTEIKSLLGQNNIWADAGDVEVTYRADTKLFCQKNDTVDDVRINGTSVVQNGVANVPIASPDAFGVVKVRENSDGLLIDGNNRLVIAGAPSSLIKSAGTNYRPVTPLRQHESAFYGLAKAAGADMASSSNAVGTYTDAAKKAIRKMLGIPNQEWEKIGEYTVAENIASYEITTDSNGQAFKLSEMLVKVFLEPTTTGTRDHISATNLVITDDNVNATTFAPTKRYMSADGSCYMQYRIKIEGGSTISEGFAANGPVSTQPMDQINYSGDNIAALRGFRLSQYSTTGTLIPAGTVVKLYGIRIDE